MDIGCLGLIFFNCCHNILLNLYLKEYGYGTKFE